MTRAQRHHPDSLSRRDGCGPPSWAALAVALLVAATATARPEFTKKNRSEVIADILKEVGRESGGSTAMADSGSGKVSSDMDVTCKLTVRRADGSIDNDLTSRFIEVANRLYPGGDFALDEHGSIQSKILDTAVHDAKNAVPDFRCALPPREFASQYAAALERKLGNPDAYFTGGGNRKQVDLRMQSKSRLRIFHADGSEETVAVDRSDRDGYAAAMKKYFGMYPEETMARRHGRDLFGDAFDAYRQARLHEHADDPARGDAKYNTRIVNDLLELRGLPPWNRLKTAQKEQVLRSIFPQEEHVAGRSRIMNVLDRSFSIYMGRGGEAPTAVADVESFRTFSEMFQRGAITSISAKRAQDLFDPRVTLRDIYDNAEARAQSDGKIWRDLSKDERKAYFARAKAEQPELVNKLKMAAAIEFGAVMRSLRGMDDARADAFKKQLLAGLAPAERERVRLQLELAQASTRDPSNQDANTARALAAAKQSGLVAKVDLDEAKAQRLLGLSVSAVLVAGKGAYDTFSETRAQWEELKNRLDPSARDMARTLDRLDKVASVVTLIKVYQDSGGDPEAMKRAVYQEAMSRFVPGYDSYVMYKQWRSGDPAAQQRVVEGLTFQGLTLLPGGALARGAKLAFDVGKGGLEVTIGYALNELGKENVKGMLEGTNAYDSILHTVPGANVEEKRRNLFSSWKQELGFGIALSKLERQRRYWQSLHPSLKALEVNRKRYLHTLETFSGLVRTKLEQKVDGYLGATAAGARGTVATGSREMLLNVLHADFFNGLNRTVQADVLKDLKSRQGSATSSPLDDVDDYLYGLFSGTIDGALDALLGAEPDADPRRRASGGWDLRFDLPRDDAGGLAVLVQAIPPLDPSAADRELEFQLRIDDSRSGLELLPGADPEHPRFRLTVAVDLVDPRSAESLVSRTFVYEGETTAPKPKELGTEFDQCYSHSFIAADTRVCSKYRFERRGTTCLIQGAVKVWIENGPTMCESTYRDGRRDGVYREYGNTGAVYVEGAFANDKMEGTWTWFFANGQKMAQYDFVAGDVHGKVRYWHENGSLKQQGQCDAARYVGTWTEWDADGRPTSETVYGPDSRTRTDLLAVPPGKFTEKGTLHAGGFTYPEFNSGLCYQLLGIPEDCNVRLFNNP